MSLYPLFLKLNGRRVLVVGGGTLATAKVAALQEAGAVIALSRRALARRALAGGGCREDFTRAAFLRRG